MPSKKIFFILIVCGGLVTSFWLISKQKTILFTSGAQNTVSAVDPRPDIQSNEDWKKMLTGVDTVGNIVADLTANKESSLEDTTLTAQLAKDVFSSYLSSTQVSEFDSGVAEQIVDNVLSIPEYTNAEGATYIESNLKIVPNNQNNFDQYKITFNAEVREKLSMLNSLQDPVSILSDALESDDETIMKKINPLVKINSDFINDLLAMNVPEEIVELHLNVLNASSDTLSNLQGIASVFSDPLKSLTAIGEYEKNINQLISALGDINTYFEQN